MRVASSHLEGGNENGLNLPGLTFGTTINKRSKKLINLLMKRWILPNIIL